MSTLPRQHGKTGDTDPQGLFNTVDDLRLSDVLQTYPDIHLGVDGVRTGTRDLLAPSVPMDVGYTVYMKQPEEGRAVFGSGPAEPPAHDPKNYRPNLIELDRRG